MKKLFVFITLLSLLQAKSQKTNNHILVVSGGGARGAWGAGFAKRLSDSFGIYNVAFASTGSLMNPLILLGDFDRLQNYHSLLFDSVKMTRLWNEGYKGTEDKIELATKPDEITIGRETAANYFKQLYASRQKLKKLNGE